MEDPYDPYYTDTPVVPTSTMDIADADPTQTTQGVADESAVVDFTPYAGEELVRIGDQIVSRADLQRRGSDYYTSPTDLAARSFDTGGGFYRNPYASGYGMDYQDPYAGQRFMPQQGLMRPTGFGGKGGYSQPMYSPYGPPPSGGMSPGKGGGYGQRTGQSYEDVVRAGNGGINPVVGPNGERLYDNAGDTGIAGAGLQNSITPEQLAAPTPPPSSSAQASPMRQQMYPMMRQQMYPSKGVGNSGPSRIPYAPPRFSPYAGTAYGGGKGGR